jgi:hypothetical protein
MMIRFEPYSTINLPLPFKMSKTLTVVLFRSHYLTPVRYAISLKNGATISDVKNILSMVSKMILYCK